METQFTKQVASQRNTSAPSIYNLMKPLCLELTFTAIVITKPFS